MIFANDHCVMCGSYVPEGRQVCKNCEDSISQNHINNAINTFPIIETIIRRNVIMNKFMNAIASIGIFIFLFGFIVCIFIDLPKWWIVIPMFMVSGQYIYNVHWQRRRKLLEARKIRRSSRIQGSFLFAHDYHVLLWKKMTMVDFNVDGLIIDKI